uniref:C2H2-type domain-containing protein n=1 Tax=Timema monikensis TaxID=170555 RepID=A0A7R9EB28_9NEOP|nr:unnamed protein product [Timema monikensis]
MALSSPTHKFTASGGHPNASEAHDISGSTSRINSGKSSNKNEDSTCLPRLIESEVAKPDTNNTEHSEENENNVSILSFVEVILDEGISHIGLNEREDIKTSDHSEREECFDVTKFAPSESKRKRDRLKFRFQCNDCPKCYKFKYEIKNHAMKHTGERPFKCTFCDYKFRYSSHLTIHLKIHKGLRDFVCSECGKSFYRKHDLQRHGTVHSAKKPFSCELCEASFTQKSNLKAHSLTHNGLRPFQCKVCVKSYTKRCLLTRHEVTHTKSPYCLKRLSSPSDKGSVGSATINETAIIG